MAKSLQAAEKKYFDLIARMLCDATGIDFIHYKTTTIRRRLQRRMNLHDLENLKGYHGYLKKHPEELRFLHQDLLINVTSFFRDPKTFEALKKIVFKPLLKKRSHEPPIRIWVPGCSTGEEAYSIAIALLETIGHSPRPPIQIFATDVNETSLEKARAGCYPLTIADQVAPERLRRFFSKAHQSYRINEDVRDLCIFARQNLTRDPPFSKMDLISCRNLLIYLEPAPQKKIMTIFHYALKPAGFLSLGSSEGGSGLANFFALVDRKHKIYAKKQLATPLNLDLSDRFNLLSSAPAFSRAGLREHIKLPKKALPSRQNTKKGKKSETTYLRQELAAAKEELHSAAEEHESILEELRSANEETLSSNEELQSTNEELETAKEELQATNEELTTVNEELQKRNDELKKGLQKLKEARDYSEGIVENVRNPLVVLDDRFQVQRANGIFYRDFKISKSQAQGRVIFELSGGDWNHPRLRELLQDVLPRNTKIRDFQVEISFANLGPRILLINANRIYQGKKGTKLILLSLEDITERTLFEQKLRQSEEKFRLLVDGVRDYAIFMLNPEGLITSWNKGAQRIKGYTAEEIIGKHFSIFYPAEEIKKETPQRELEGATQAGRVEHEGWRLRKDGSRLWANVVLTAISDPSGTLLGFAKITRDMTERKRAEEALALSEKRYRQILETAYDSFISIDGTGVITHWNPQAEKDFGWKSEEVLGKRLSETIIPPEYREAHERGLRHFLSTGEGPVLGRRMELPALHRHGHQFPVELTISPLRIGDTHVFNAFVHDISQRKKVEEELRQARDELELRISERTRDLEEANQTLERLNQIKSDFTSLVSHELRTPLSAINEAVRLVLDGIDGDVNASQVKTLEIAKNNVERLDRLINNVLNFSSLESGQIKMLFERTDLNVLLTEACDTMRSILQSYDFRLTLPPGGVPTICDADKIKQVVFNLLGNAVKFTPAGGKIELTLHVSGSEIHIEVEDSGIGMKEEDQKKIFQMFSQIHHRGLWKTGGWGVGLAVCRLIISQHSGRIEIESEPERGSRFRVIFPQNLAAS